MEAQISPMLGLTLLEHADVWTITALVVSAIAAGASAGVAIVIWKTQGRQLDHQTKLAEHQKKLDSARLVMELDHGLRSDDFRDTAVQIRDSDIDPTKPDDELLLLRYINYVTPICKMHYDGLISKPDMESSYDGVIVMLVMNERIRKYIQENKDVYRYLYRYMLAILKS